MATRSGDGDEDGLDPQQPVYYEVYGEWTKKAGYARARPGSTPEMLVWEDKSFGGFFGRLQKAEEADVFAFRMEGFDDSPDWFVAGPDLANPRQVTETNPFQSEYAWGGTELVDYENEWARAANALTLSVRSAATPIPRIRTLPARSATQW